MFIETFEQKQFDPEGGRMSFLRTLWFSLIQFR